MAEDGEDAVMPSTEKKWKMPLFVFFRDARCVFNMDALGLEILHIALPAALALAADPVASLIDTAFIGRLGAVEIAAVGVSIAIFNQASKVTIFPLVSITTSFVAEENAVGRITLEEQKVENSEKSSTKDNEMKELKPEEVILENLEKGAATNSETKELMSEYGCRTTAYKSPNVNSSILYKSSLISEKRHIPSASTALVIGAVLGILQTIFLICLAKPLLGIMGVKSDSPMLGPARRYLTLRSLGAPAVLLSLAMQGVFRGFKDTTTPLFATVAGDVSNVILDPILIFACHMGVSGAAIAHVLSQYLILMILFCQLIKQVDLFPPSIKTLQFSRFLKNVVMISSVTFSDFKRTLAKAAVICLQLDGF